LVVTEASIRETCGDPDLPPFGVVEQRWDTDPIPEERIRSTSEAAVGNLELDRVPSGGEVAVGVGSRGIANLPAIVSGTIEGLQDRGYDPFVFPAMGSHGGATGAGQREQLASLGITEDVIGCEIRATMDVVTVGETPERGVPVYMDAQAAAADAIVPINRVKPHTSFVGEVESGLAKMLVIGMGKQAGAKTAHAWAVDWSLSRMVPEITELLLAELPIPGGVAIVEDQHHDTTIIEGVPATVLLDREADLLKIAYDRLPTLPWDELDVAIVDQLGKNISGTGMDTNVIGRLPHFFEPKPSTPTIRRIFARSITEESHGNAAGLGSADFVHRDVLEAYDPETTLINGLTASSVRAQRLPPVVETDRAGLTASIGTIGEQHCAPEDIRAVRITDTQSLQRFYASPALVEDAQEREDLDVRDGPQPINFDATGDFVGPLPSSLR
jgi:hypothetical protein